MSITLAIAAVTAVLKDLIENGLVTDAIATSVGDVVVTAMRVLTALAVAILRFKLLQSFYNTSVLLREMRSGGDCTRILSARVEIVDIA